MLKFKDCALPRAVLRLGGCASDPVRDAGPREGTGTAVGALTGA